MGLISLGSVAMGVFSTGLVAMGAIAAGFQTMGLVSIGSQGMGNIRIPIGIETVQPNDSGAVPPAQKPTPIHSH